MNVSYYSNIVVLPEQILELIEVIELYPENPEVLKRLGIIPPKCCFLYVSSDNVQIILV